MRLPSPGEVFQEKYEIHQIIGKGGFATVYRATDLEVGRDVALKILSPRDGEYPEAVVARFMREARLLAGLQDPHTITMFDFGRTDDGLLFMVFEYVSGLDLAEVLKRRERLSSGEVAHIVKQVLYALREAHDAGVFHRDIKPPNLLIYEYMGEKNCVKLLDFGVAKPGESHPLGEGNLTREGAMVGTPRYMAPEQIYGRSLTPAADIYSLGLVAYEMLTGRPAMDAKTNKERVRQQLSDTRTLVPAEFGTPELRRVVNRMLVKDPEGRFQSASEALAALRSGNSESERQRPRRPKVVTPSESDTVDESALPVAKVPTKVTRVVAIGLATAAMGLLLVVLVGRLGRSEEPVEPIKSAEIAPAIVPVVPDTAEPEAVATPPKIAPRDGCGLDPGERGLRDRVSMIALRQRAWVWYLPKDYDPHRRYPVMLMFHNMFSDPRSFIDATQMQPLADEKGFVIIAVASEKGNAWKDVDDFEVVTKALEEARSELCLDDSQLFSMGHGRGGWFARDLGCYMPLSAVATSGSGQRVGEVVCRPIPPVPTLRLYGTADKFIPAKGGAGCVGGDYVSALEIEEQWASRYGCSAPPVPWPSHENGTCVIRQCDANARFVSCALDGGHDWPTAPPGAITPNCIMKAADFPYRDTIWEFFTKEGRRL